MKKYGKYLLLLLIVIFIIVVLVIDMNKERLYSRNYFYMDTYINVKFNTKNKNKAEIVLKKINDIYSKYQKLTDVYDKDSEISYINDNDSSKEEIEIDKELYNILELSLSWYNKSNHKFNINMDKVIKIWKRYRDNKDGIPELEELETAKNSINELELLGNNKIKNNKPSIDLGAIAKGYATGKVASMLKENNINSFVINAGGNVVVGKPSNKDNYSIGIESPLKDGSVYQVVKGSNISVVTSGGYQRFYEYNGVRYHHIIDPDTLFPANNMLSVSVITEDSALADILSTVLFLLPVDEGKALVESMDNVEAIFYIDENNIVKSKGFSKYE